ncbi:hypothetical protein BV25DRAFT_1819020 [Artomyces pyxidatus]|uniref:Uncharacterized protein n=1 Tax=Artomyces pyxidatus TaxID=48021 RepID=A0ACB8TGW4_9AGAM|nr:hypothetical protein BV25DRAFT_1819020 [Artomyces pyxidatus]
MSLSNPDALEKIFLKLEKESERRALLDEATRDLPDLVPDHPIDSLRRRRERRRGSVSISRFGQIADTARGTQLTFSVPQSPLLTPNNPLASFYQAQSHAASADSLSSTDSEDVPGHRTAHDHVTQVHRIAARRSVGGILSRTLSRSRSKNSLSSNGIDTNVVIGVVVEEAHAEEEQEIPRPATAYGPNRELREQASRFTIGAGESQRGWTGRAKDLFGKKFRRRSSTLGVPGG